MKKIMLGLMAMALCLAASAKTEKVCVSVGIRISYYAVSDNEFYKVKIKKGETVSEYNVRRFYEIAHSSESKTVLQNIFGVPYLQEIVFEGFCEPQNVKESEDGRDIFEITTPFDWNAPVEKDAKVIAVYSIKRTYLYEDAPAQPVAETNPITGLEKSKLIFNSKAQRDNPTIGRLRIWVSYSEVEINSETDEVKRTSVQQSINPVMDVAIPAGGSVYDGLMRAYDKGAISSREIRTLGHYMVAYNIENWHTVALHYNKNPFGKVNPNPESMYHFVEADEPVDEQDCLDTLFNGKEVLDLYILICRFRYAD